MVISVNITIRGIDESVYKRFKAKAVEEGMKLGEAATHVMEIWIEQRGKKPRKTLLDMKPFSWGDNTEKTSVQIDQIVYGEEL